MTRILEAPTVTLIARPQFIEPAHLACEWKGDGSDGERLCEYAGRLCYMSFHNPAGRTTEGYLKNILTMGHGSVLEHAVYVFLLEGISRSCSHELVRHRAGFGYSQLSQRYVDSSDVAFVIPPTVQEANPMAIAAWRSSCEEAARAYKQLTDFHMIQFQHVEDKTARIKLAREAARSVLPNATETKIVVSGNLRAWRTMLELRCNPAAEREIRRVALMILKVLKQEAPSVFSDFTVTDDQAFPYHHKV